MLPIEIDVLLPVFEDFLEDEEESEIDRLVKQSLGVTIGEQEDEKETRKVTFYKVDALQQDTTGSIIWLDGLMFETEIDYFDLKGMIEK